MRVYAVVAILALSLPVAAESVIRRAGIGEPETLDPHLWVDGWAGNIVQDLFLGLTTLFGSLKIQKMRTNGTFY